ncbi:MAG: ABC transporter ATP-binding protein [Lachnospiraceae bacterium]|nr:ABC transporter ATP-binding protein [Lachnospiraceae bacterium]
MKKYSLLSNYTYAMTPIVKHEKVFFAEWILSIIMSVLVPIAGSMLSAFVVWLLGTTHPILMVVIAITIVFLLYGVINAAQDYVFGKGGWSRPMVRVTHFAMPVIEKMLRMPLEDAENSDVILAKEKAEQASDGGSNRGIEPLMLASARLISAVIGFVSYLIIIGTIHPLIMVASLMVGIVGALIGRIPNRYYMKVRDELAKERVTMNYISRKIDDTSTGKDIRAFSMSDYLIRKYDESIGRTRKYDAKYTFVKCACSIADMLLYAAVDIVCYMYLINMMKNGLSITMFVFYIGIVFGISQWIKEIADNYVSCVNSSKVIGGYREYMELGNERVEKSIVPDDGFNVIDIVFDHVSYKYTHSDRYVLKDVSFHVERGDHIALVGLNGAGKSTIAKLISGLYLPTEGNIYINGINTKDIDRKAYYDKVSAIFQETLVLSYTIAENVALSIDYDKDRVIEAITKAGLMDKVNTLPYGIDTYIGQDISEEGINLSGGERQKLLLARALYRNPAFIIFDEPTAALDALAESEIYELCDKRLENITSLFISHRLASTRFCKEIILLEDGKIAELGSHEELMEKKNEYYKLFEIQSKYYKEEVSSDVD